ncbi:hypothetical protein ACFL5V_09350 [Fibrobacterota bacterium]
MLDGISLLGDIKAGGFEASIITTYNAFLPFYEEVVLRRLVSSGCRHNVVLMDENEFRKSLKDENRRPKYAGLEYTLIPIKAPKVFHPKIIFLVGPKQCLLNVGSHNLTVSGFGINREQTCEINYTVSSGEECPGAVNEALDFITSWVKSKQSIYPKQVLDSVLNFKEHCPWLKKISPSSSVFFLGQGPYGESLWSKLRKLITGNVDDLNIIGPFFDSKLQFLKALHDELKPKNMAVGINPSTVQIPDNFLNFSQAKFVNTKDLSKKSGYLHAKAIYLKINAADDLIIIGSANPSYPAWLDVGDGNAEAVMVLKEADLADKANELGLKHLGTLPVISRSEALEVKPLEKTEPENLTNEHFSYAIYENNNLSLGKIAGITGNIKTCTALTEKASIHIPVNKIEEKKDTWAFNLDKNQLSHIRSLELHLEGALIHAIVYNITAIKERSQTGKQAKLRKCCELFMTENPEVENLMRVIESAIFNDDFTVRKITSKQNTKQTAQSIGNENHGSLIVSMDSAISKKARRRIIEHGDINALFEVLSKSLYIGTERHDTNLDNKGRSEEEQVGADDEDTQEQPVEIINQDLIELCQKRVKRLINRAGRFLEKASKMDNETQVKAIMRLLAVIKFIQELRYMERRMPWVDKSQTLVPILERVRLLDFSLIYLFGSKYCFYEKAIDSYGRDTEELTQILGVVGWLFWDSGLPGKKHYRYMKKKDIKPNEEFLQTAKLMSLMLYLCQDNEACKLTKSSLKRLCNSSLINAAHKWLNQSVKSFQGVVRYMYLSELPEDNRIPSPGDLVLVKISEKEAISRNLFLHVVEKSDKTYAYLTDLNPKFKSKNFGIDRVSLIESDIK